MRHGSLFSGIGGFDLAAEWMGWTNIFHCEWAEFQRKILDYHFPNAISYDNIKTTDFTPHRGQIDVLTGGFPCQPFSLAGKRKGADDDRYLWDEMLRAIREIQPTWIVGENVAGLISMAQPGETIGMEIEGSLFGEDNKAVETVSPLDLSPDPSLSWEEHMKKDIAGMMQCDAIYMIDGWEKSRGAILEHYIARQLGMKVVKL